MEMEPSSCEEENHIRIRECLRKEYLIIYNKLILLIR